MAGLFKSWYRKWEINRSVMASYGDFEFYCEPEATEHAELLFGKLAHAIALIAEVDPHRFRNLQRYVQRFLIKTGAGAAYWSNHDCCVLQTGWTLRAPTEYISGTLVHEATHGLFYHRISCHIGERVERRCVKEQVAFAMNMQAAGYEVRELIEHYEEILERPIVTPSSKHQQRLRGARAFKLPEAGVKLIDVFFKPRRGA